jgi:hypothetical protein
MGADDFLDAEVGLAAGATAALLSPRVRELLRTGAVYGTAGVMAIGDTAFGAARGAGRGIQRMSGRGPNGRSSGSRSGGRSTASRSGSGNRRSGGASGSRSSGRSRGSRTAAKS